MSSKCIGREANKPKTASSRQSAIFGVAPWDTLYHCSGDRQQSLGKVAYDASITPLISDYLARSSQRQLKRKRLVHRFFEDLSVRCLPY